MNGAQICGIAGWMYSGLVSEQTTPSTRTRTGWKMLLVLPYLALMFPQVYARATPEFLGFPFFYWYQFMWVILTAGLLGLVYKKVKY
jgi:hypothetical protein